MSDKKIECCPVCLCTHKTYLEATGGEWVGLILNGYGGIKPNVCLNCGTVYVPGKEIEYINRGKKK